jgi:hypothetical protein
MIVIPTTTATPIATAPPMRARRRRLRATARAWEALFVLLIDC